jgi:hypothetical protein
MSEEIALEVLERAFDADDNLCEDTKRFIDRHVSDPTKSRWTSCRFVGSGGRAFGVCWCSYSCTSSRPPKTDRGEALEQAEWTFFRMIFLRQVTAPRPELMLSWKRKIFSAWKPQCVGRALCWRRRNEDLSLSRDGRGTQSSRFRHFGRFGDTHVVGLKLMRQWRWRVERDRRADIVGRVDGDARRHH